MNKLTYYLIFGLLIFTSCSDDDDDTTPNPQPPAQNIQVVINEVSYLGTDWIEITNQGSTTADISEYWLCLGPGTYQQIGSLEVLSGNTSIPAEGFLVVGYDLPDADGGIGLYTTNSDFTDASTLVDFVQYGSGGSSRENVAVAASEWTAGEFVPVVSNQDHTIVFDGEGNSASDWAETTTVTVGAENVLTMPNNDIRSVVINEVNYGETKLIELWNNGTVAVDLSSYWLCLGPGQYVQVQNASIVSGSANLEAGEFLVINWDQLTNSEGLGLYSVNSFTDANAIVDFVQWGAEGSARENIAVEAGIWTAGDFVPVVALPSFSIAYDGEGEASTDWSETVNPTFGLGNDTVGMTTTFNVTIKNTINYLATKIYNTGDQNTDPGSINNAGDTFTTQFQAVPGAKMSFVSMSSITNDWIFAPRGTGIDVFDQDGNPITGNITNQILLWDVGTEEENPATVGGNGADMREGDDDDTVRIVSEDVSEYIRVELTDYDTMTRTFTMVITNVRGVNADPTPIRVSPGIVVLHAQENPFFTVGMRDRGVGLQLLAERGNPSELWDWFNETGSQGTPLRLSSSFTPFSPALIYAFNTDKDPWFTQGEASKALSGVEEIAEDGNRMVAYNYLKNFGIPVALPAEMGPILPGGSFTFTIEVPKDQNYKLGFGTMFVKSNDWFISNNNVGLTLFNEDGSAFSGTSVSANTYLYDAGTEVDQPVGFGADQVMNQSGPDTGMADGNTSIRRVTSIEDIQFGKGVINSAPGVTWSGDPRGGYNIIEIDIQAQ